MSQPISSPESGAANAFTFAGTARDEPEIRKIDLKDPLVAGFLAWMAPGLGHWYQGRRSKALLFFVCVFGTFVYGLWLGDGRVVYASFRGDDMRLSFVSQAGVGLPIIPALIQSKRFQAPDLWAEKLLREHKNEPAFFDRFMAPPLLRGELRQLEDREGMRRLIDELYPAKQDSRRGDELSRIHRELHHYFELGTLYTMIAGLLNLLVIYDAVAGPAFSAPDPDKKKPKNANPATGPTAS